MIRINNPRFLIKQDVYHITPDSEKGIVLDMIYYFHTQQYKYLVTFGIGKNDWYDEHELSESKNYNN